MGLGLKGIDPFDARTPGTPYIIRDYDEDLRYSRMMAKLACIWGQVCQVGISVPSRTSIAPKPAQSWLCRFGAKIVGYSPNSVRNWAAILPAAVERSIVCAGVRSRIPSLDDAVDRGNQDLGEMHIGRAFVPDFSSQTVLAATMRLAIRQVGAVNNQIDDNDTAGLEL